jgi:PPK2 family polyphosphate:nucleotide phosphotransferase
MSKINFSHWRIKPGSTVHLEEFETNPTADAQREDVDDYLNVLFDKLDKLQTTLYAAKTKGLLLILQGMDTSGKDGAIRHVFSHISPLGVHAYAFGAPSEEEKLHDFLWRIHSKVPGRGEMVIFNRSHYEDVLVTRVKKWIDEPTVQRRFENINHFERLLESEDITVLKCYLHISKKEQKKRLQSRLDDPSKNWKLQASDFEDRKLWPEFMSAYQDALSATSTSTSPWYVVPADNKHFRNYFLAELLVHTLEKMDLQMPQPSFNLAQAKLD